MSEWRLETAELSDETWIDRLRNAGVGDIDLSRDKDAGRLLPLDDAMPLQSALASS